MKTWLAASSTSASPARKRRAAVCTALRTTRRYSRAKRSHAGRPPASSSRTASLPSAISPPDAREFYRLPTAPAQLMIDPVKRLPLLLLIGLADCAVPSPPPLSADLRNRIDAGARTLVVLPENSGLAIGLLKDGVPRVLGYGR